MIRAFGINMPKNKREALAVIRSLDKTLVSIKSSSNKRDRCSGISKVFKVVKSIYKNSRDLYLKNSDEDMRDVSIIFKKWMKINGCILDEIR